VRVAVFSTKPYDRQFLDLANAGRHELDYLDARLTAATAPLARGASAVCLFANDRADAEAVRSFAEVGVQLIALRSAGFNNVDLAAADAHGISVCRVPAYSPHAVAEHTFALILALVRKIPRAYNRVREGNFALDGLLGFDLAGKTIGVIGVGNIGSVVAQIARGFGCKVLGTDPFPRKECESAGVRYCSLDELLSEADIVTLHCPLDGSTRHLIDGRALARMKSGAILVNTSRGSVLDTRAVIGALKRSQLGGLAIDVYEEEEALFFEDHSAETIMDDQFVRLLTFPNVLITGHQAFFTQEALTAIAETTIANLNAFEEGGEPLHPVPRPVVVGEATGTINS
jgi:D-lactate dehydrogenase